MRRNYEEDNGTFSASAYRVQGYKGIAWSVWGWETEPNGDTEWSGLEERTGRVLATMVGDDRQFAFDKEDITPLNEVDYCHQCGQIGCTHDGIDRS